ncbi:MAG: alpha-2-macroglobulin [Xanthomonadaceae bacterium]|jgi:uncharacterized protein YfaS (alpha-2-macroglobulin family)|nr:alpha-2-macroglobulin [Xanthomonadaceae bacterium]
MLGTIKSIIFFTFLFAWHGSLLVLKGIGALFRWLLRSLFGISWQPPGWMRATGRRLRALWQKAAQKPLLAAVSMLCLGGLAVGSWYGWQWYQKQPKPHTVAYEVQAPDITNYHRQPLKFNALRILFTESVAPLDAIGKPVERGIRLTPAAAGGWHWANDRALVFTPENDWPIATDFRVRMDRKGLFANGTLLDDYSVGFATAPFAASIGESELYQDPENPTLRKLVATVQFTHPVDEDSVRENLSILLGPGLGYRDADAPIAPEMRFDSHGLKAYVHSAPLAMPLEQSSISMRLKSGVRARAGGNATADALMTEQVVPGRYQLGFHDIGIVFAENDKGEPEPILMFHSGSPLADNAIAGKVHAWLLPERDEDEGWSEDEIDGSLLTRANALPLTQVPSTEPLNSQHAFKFRATPERYLYVRIDDGVEALAGYLSKDPAYQLLRMPQYPRTLRFLSGGSLLSLNGEKKLGFMARGVPGAHFEIARILPNQLHHLVDQNTGDFAEPRFANSYFDRLVERMGKDIPLPGSDPSKTRYDHLDLSEYLTAQGGRHGVFVVRINPPGQEDMQTFSDYDYDYDYDGGERVGDLRFIVITDLGIIAKRSADGSHDVFVQSIGSGQPVPGAQVRILGRNGLSVAEGGTDQNGRAHFDNLDELRRERTPLMYVVSRGEDLSFLPINRYVQQLDMSRFSVGGQRDDGDRGRLQAYLFTDRGLYRPGEMAHLGMIVRGADWSMPLRGLPVELQITDPRGMTVLREPFKLAADGFQATDFRTGATAPAGDYLATLQLIGNNDERTNLGNVEFIVRDFEPDRMKVDVSLHDAPIVGWISPQQVQAKVAAMHLFGAPAADRRVTAELYLSPGFARFPRHSDYRFRVQNPLADPSSEDLPEQKTDADGQARFDLRLNRFTTATYRLQLLARVYEAEGGRNVAAENSVMVSAAEYLVGVKSADALDYVAKGARRQAQWLAVGPDLELRAVAGLSTELIEHRYVSVLVQQDNGTYKYESRRKDIGQGSQPLTLPRTGATQTLATTEPGDYSLVLRDAQGNTLNQIDYSVAGQGNASRSLERNAELQLRLDKPSFRTGEEIAISIRAPYAGAGLITIERDRVYAQQWFKTDSTSSVQRIRVPAGLEGNAYVNVQFVRDPASAEIYMSPLSYGVMPFQIDIDQRRLPLTLDAAATLEPGQTLSMKLRSAHASRAVVFAVDEGILQVARYKTPDPLGHFFRKRALEVDTRQILDLILPEFSRLVSAAAPGGDTEAELAAHLNPFRRKRKEPVAWWSGMIELRAGETTLNYQVPDSFNGKLRLFAVAVDSGHIGVAEGATEVRGPLVMTPNVPAFVAPGDVFQVSSGIYSNLESPAEIKYELQTSEGLRVENASGTLSLQPRQEGTVEFRITAQQALGSADLRLVATLPNGKRLSIAETISVRPAVPYRTQLTLGRFQQRTMELRPQRSLFPQLRDAQLNASASPLAWGGGLSQYLEGYPYNNTEQLISKAMPVLVFGDAPAKNESIPALLRTLRQRQNPQGGFGEWTANANVTPYVSLYVADFLTEARLRGQAVPEDMLTRTNGYLSRIANGPSNTLGELRDRAYASYLLSRQGMVVSGALADIRERYETRFGDEWRNDPGAMWLAAAYKLQKQDALADPLFAAQPWRLMEKEWAIDDYYDPMSRDANHLLLLSRHFPAQRTRIPDALLDRLGERLNQQRYTALSAALLLRALDAYETQAGTNMDLRAVAWFDDQRQQPLSLGGRPPHAEVPLGTTRLQMQKNGETPAFYMLSESGFDLAADAPAFDRGLEVRHEYLGLDGQPLTQVKVGEEFLVRLRMRASEFDAVPNVAIVDLLPGGVEPVYQDGQLDARGADGQHTADKKPVRGDWNPGFADARDDRVVLYGNLSRNASTYVYRVRATHPGEFVTPGAYAESMYISTLQSRGRAGRLGIVKP